MPEPQGAYQDLAPPAKILVYETGFLVLHARHTPAGSCAEHGRFRKMCRPDPVHVFRLLEGYLANCCSPRKETQ